MTKDPLKAFIKKYHISDTSLYLIEEALTHSSYANEHNTKHNERLEFLGDSVLNMLVAEEIFKNYKNMAEGEMTKLRAASVCEEANAMYARSINLSDMLKLGHGEELSGGRFRDAILNDAFEALVAAIYLTEGIVKTREILKDIVFPNIGKITETSFIDYKSKLQEYVQSETREALVYKEISEVGRPHDKTFTMAVYLDDVKLGVGVGKSKKQAEQFAAKQALEKMAK